MKLLVTGGAGYIGSHVVLQLGEAGHDITVVDDLSTGSAEAVLHGKLVQADIADAQAMEAVFRAGHFDAVLHFAASIVAPESVSEPLKYYANNTGNMLRVLDLCRRHAVRQFVFSSTAAVYGVGRPGRLAEDAPLAPINPYGASKMMSERMLSDLAAASDLRYVTLRYFNVAGADPQGRIGQAGGGATHLIKVACQAALGLRPDVPIYGTDYPTPDGTCIRDYVHVVDLASAHVAALDYLGKGGASETLNCGYGRGYSVREVLKALERVLQRRLKIRETARRPGDAMELVADNTRISRLLSWQPQLADLDRIVESALRWEQRRVELASGRRSA